MTKNYFGSKLCEVLNQLINTITAAEHYFPIELAFSLDNEKGLKSLFILYDGDCIFSTDNVSVDSVSKLVNRVHLDNERLLNEKIDGEFEEFLDVILSLDLSATTKAKLMDKISEFIEEPGTDE